MYEQDLYVISHESDIWICVWMCAGRSHRLLVVGVNWDAAQVSLLTILFLRTYYLQLQGSPWRRTCCVANFLTWANIQILDDFVARVHQVGNPRAAVGRGHDYLCVSSTDNVNSALLHRHVTPLLDRDAKPCLYENSDTLLMHSHPAVLLNSVSIVGLVAQFLTLVLLHDYDQNFNTNVCWILTTYCIDDGLLAPSCSHVSCMVDFGFSLWEST